MIFRYELFWLPLLAQLAQHSSVDLAAPLDIAWVWHVHLLSPLSYERDCNEVVSVLVDHRILVGKAREKGLKKARALWKQKYPKEPFEVDLNAPVTCVQDFESRIQYDIKSACQRQRVFYYQVSLPHYANKTFLRELLRGISTICSSSKRIKMLFLYHAMTLTLSGMPIKWIRWSTDMTPSNCLGGSWTTTTQ